MIALLSYSINSLKSSAATSFPTGGIPEDSVLIAYDDLRIVNAKIIELNYEREINDNLRDIIANDSVAISNLNFRISNMDNSYKREINKLKRERNIGRGIGIGAIILLVISIL